MAMLVSPGTCQLVTLTFSLSDYPFDAYQVHTNCSFVPLFLHSHFSGIFGLAYIMIPTVIVILSTLWHQIVI